MNIFFYPFDNSNDYIFIYRFAVNFCSAISCCFCRYTHGKDVAFSLRAHFDRRCIVRNSTHKLKWQQEEAAGSQDFPLARKSDFCVEIFIAAREFFVSIAVRSKPIFEEDKKWAFFLQVAINGIHFCTFLLRTALSSINSIEILGDIKIDGVSINSSQEVYPSPSITEIPTTTNTFQVTNFDNNSFNCRDSVST